MSSSPSVVPPRPEGISRRGIMIIVLIIFIVMTAQWISTRPLTRKVGISTPTAMVSGSASSPTQAVGMRCDGIYERLSPWIEICYHR